MPRRKQAGRRPHKGRLWLPAALAMLVLLSAGATFYLLFFRPPPVRPPAAPDRPLLSPKPFKVGPPEPDFPAPFQKELPPASSAGAKPLPQVILVIDDMGYHRDLDEQLVALDLDLTFSFLPFGPHTRSLAAKAGQRGRDVLLHVPMEPTDTQKWDPGPGALYQNMPPEAMRLCLEQNLAGVPLAVGINNHMGSRFTENRRAMAVVLSFCRARGLFFLDSLTSPRSVAYDAAQKMGVPALRRDIFLDNVQEKEAIKKQLAAMINLAKKQGAAIGIAHPHSATLAALAESLPRLQSAVKVVGARAFLRSEATQ